MTECCHFSVVASSRHLEGTVVGYWGGVNIGWVGEGNGVELCEGNGSDKIG